MPKRLGYNLPANGWGFAKAKIISALQHINMTTTKSLITNVSAKNSFPSLFGVCAGAMIRKRLVGPMVAVWVPTLSSEQGPSVYGSVWLSRPLLVHLPPKRHERVWPHFHTGWPDASLHLPSVSPWHPVCPRHPLQFPRMCPLHPSSLKPSLFPPLHLHRHATVSPLSAVHQHCPIKRLAHTF